MSNGSTRTSKQNKKSKVKRIILITLVKNSTEKTLVAVSEHD